MDSSAVNAMAFGSACSEVAGFICSLSWLPPPHLPITQQSLGGLKATAQFSIHWNSCLPSSSHTNIQPLYGCLASVLVPLNLCICLSCLITSKCTRRWHALRAQAASCFTDISFVMNTQYLWRSYGRGQPSLVAPIQASYRITGENPEEMAWLLLIHRTGVLGGLFSLWRLAPAIPCCLYGGLGSSGTSSHKRLVKNCEELLSIHRYIEEALRG